MLTWFRKSPTSSIITRLASRRKKGSSFRMRLDKQATWHPQGPPTSAQPPRATTFWMTDPPPDDGATGIRAGWEARRHVVARGGGVGWMGPCGCQARDLAEGAAVLVALGLDVLGEPPDAWHPVAWYGK